MKKNSGTEDEGTNIIEKKKNPPKHLLDIQSPSEFSSKEGECEYGD